MSSVKVCSQLFYCLAHALHLLFLGGMGCLVCVKYAICDRMQGCAKRITCQGQPSLANVLLDLDGSRQRTLMRSIKNVCFTRLNHMFQNALEAETGKPSDPEPLGLGKLYQHGLGLSELISRSCHMSDLMPACRRCANTGR